MPDVAHVLKQEISRLARREVRRETAKLRQQVRKMMGVVSTQKKEIEQLHRSLAELSPLVVDCRAGLAAAAPAGRHPEADNGRADGAGRQVTPEALKRLRSRLGLSQVELAGLLKVSANTVVRWEAGRCKPRARHRVSIAALRGRGKREIRQLVGG
ncbi:MAG: helix-turn-helix transcriptional regulator [Candidatus Latescibacterota bacterium]